MRISLGWNNVVSQGGRRVLPDPLSAVGYTSDVDKHSVCQEVRDFVDGAGKKGSEVRRNFLNPPYGWSRDTVDGALLALLAGGFLRGHTQCANSYCERNDPTTGSRY